MMIYTLTFNPSLDYVMNVENFALGDVNRAFGDMYLAGGKGINVSSVLAEFGAETKALGFLGGFVGDEIERRLSDMGILCEFVRIAGGTSRINVKVKSHEETEINAAGPNIGPEDMARLYDKLDCMTEGDVLVLAGSIPKGIDKNIYRDIMKKYCHKNIDFVVDAEGDLLKNTLQYKPFLIKPNNFELGDIFGRELTDIDEIIECAEKLRDEGARNVLVSMGGDGAVLVCEDGSRYYSAAPVGRLVNSTGAGDSGVAGFLYGYSRYRDCKQAFAYALCSGSACAFSEKLPTFAEIEAIMTNQNIIEKIDLK